MENENYLYGLKVRLVEIMMELWESYYIIYRPNISEILDSELWVFFC